MSHHQTMHRVCNPFFYGRQVQVRSTPKPNTPFGGLVSLISFFERIGLASKVSEATPFVYKSNNAIPTAQSLVAFLVSVVVGARGLAPFPFQSLHLGLTWAMASLPPVASQLLADRALAHAQNLGNFLLYFSGFHYSIDDLTVFVAEMSVSLLLHCFLFPTQR